MKKIAGTWIGTTELDMGDSGATGSSTDPVQDSYELGDMFVAEKFTTDNELPSMGWAEGMISPVEDEFADLEEAEEAAILSMASLHLAGAAKANSSLIVGFKDGFSRPLLKAGKNITMLNRESVAHSYSDKAHRCFGDSRFYSVGRKFDSFCIASRFSNSSDFNIEISNITRHLRPVSSGLIISRSSEDLSEEIKKLGFKIQNKHIGKFSTYLVSRNVKDKMAIVRCYSSKDKSTAVFRCDIAKTSKEKLDGLQVYPTLEKNSGLIFSYKRPTDAIFHMGSVGYPIDIIFIDKEDKIKKICKNIKPGSLETFSCTNIKTVLEISGGLSDALSISEGSYVSIDIGGDLGSPEFEKIEKVASSISSDNIYIKSSTNLNSGFYKFAENNIFITNNSKDISYSNIIKKAKLPVYLKEKVAIFNIDESIISSQEVPLYRHLPPNGLTFRGLDNESFSIKDDAFINVKLSSFVRDGFKENLENIYSFACSPTKSFKNLISSGRRSCLKEVFNQLRSKNTRVVFATKHNYNRNLIRKIIQAEANMGYNAPVVDFDLLRIPEYFDHKDTILAAKQAYQGADVFLFSNDIVKQAGVPVPDSIKENGKKVIKFFDRSDDSCRKLIDNFKKNLNEYDKIQSEAEKIASSKGQYRQSIKRNSRIIKRILLNIKEGIKVLNEIKDVSTTSEVIDAVATSAKVASESVKNIFNLMDIIDSPDFFGKLQQETDAADNLLEDLRMSLSRAREYINSDILGILIISE
tara:strand:+ start:8195 stop:10444 length:2250 start_codon:yes stop_codon:yes gene_type:complete